jgi:CRP-like cAMP-binding protein
MEATDLERKERMKKALDRLSPIPEETWQSFCEELQFKTFPKGTTLCREGAVEKSIYFLDKGATRNYFQKNGKEFTVEFHFEQEFVTAFYSLVTAEPSPVTIEAISDIEALLIPYETLLKFYNKSHAVERVGRKIAEEQYIRRLRKEMELLSMTAEHRYAKLLQRDPGLVLDISVKHLSSYLGIQPESLSRIRKKYSGN